jgi:Yip1 domain
MLKHWPDLKVRLVEALKTLPRFLRHPTQGMRTLPDWDWPTMLVLHGAFAAAIGLTCGLLERRILSMISGLLIQPFQTLVLSALLAAFFYYVFLFFEQKALAFRSLYTHVAFASLPTLILQVPGVFVPSVMLVGVLSSLGLLWVGFTHNYQVDASRLKKILLGLLALYLLVWALELISSDKRQKIFRQHATPESLDILQRELEGK